MLENLTWTCHICGKERPDNKISVRTTPLECGFVRITQNVRYCNDNTECIEESKTFRFTKDSYNEN